MLKKVVTYVDFNGEECTETLYFNLTKAEIATMELEVPGGLSATLDRIVQEKNTPEMMHIFKELVGRSYGIKSEDGKKFKKSKEIREDFENSAAYSELFMGLFSTDNAAAEFINGIFPSDLIEKAKKIEKK